MSMPPEPPDPPSLSSNSPISSSKALASPSAPIIDLLDTPLFNRLIGLIEELSFTVKEQRIALQEQNALATKQREVLEEQTNVMKDMRRALVDHKKSTARDTLDDNKLDFEHDRSSTKSKPAAPTSPSHNLPSPSIHQMIKSAEGDHTLTITPIPDVDGFPINRTERAGEQIGAGIVGESTAEEGMETTTKPPSNPIHDTLVLLSKTMETVKETLIEHGRKFDILTRDAIKDDQPYELKAPDDESTCTALFEMAMTKTKEEVDEWIKRMDVSLVFIALFSAVLTAFVVPANQNLFPSSNNSPGNPTDSPPPVPKTSAQDVCILYYLALILAILNAVLSVLGRQWMSKLTAKPVGNTYRERLLRHIAREALAKRWLGYLVEGLHILLLWSIGLFMTGLLYQILNLSGSFERSTPRIFAAWVLGIILSSSIMVVVLAATTHALVYEVSPFGGPFSKVLFKSARVLSVSFDWLEYKVDKIAAWLDRRIKSIPFYRILPAGCKIIAWPLWLCALLVDDWRIDLDQGDREKLVGAFMDLIAEASDPKLLERAVGSFSYVEWFKNGKGTADQLEKTWNRLRATDTSVRVRETLRARMTQFVKYHHEQSKEITQKAMRVLANVCPIAERFNAEVYSASFGADNADLRGLSLLPFEECIARVLCSYNHEEKLGDRERIFNLAEKQCSTLIREGNVDDVTRILSYVDRLDIIKSYIQHLNGVDRSLVEFIVKDHEHEILHGINKFLRTVDQSRLNPRSLVRVFLVLASPPPTDIDLSPLIDYLSRHPHYYTWRETSDTIIAYLDSFDLSQFSDSTAVRRSLQQCVNTQLRDEDGYRCFTSDETRDRARELLAELNSFPSLPTGAIASTSIQPGASSHSLSRTPTPDDSPELDHLLLPYADSLPPAPENIEFNSVPFANPPSDIPLTPLNHPPPTLPSSESTSNPSLSPVQHSQAVFEQSPALENAQKKD